MPGCVLSIATRRAPQLRVAYAYMHVHTYINYYVQNARTPQVAGSATCLLKLFIRDLGRTLKTGVSGGSERI